MLSVLVPIFNWNVLDLVTEVDRQLSKAEINYEIICLEDGSAPEFISNNQKIQRLSEVIYHISVQNKGRIQSRKFLSSQARFEWLLFLDADTEIRSTDFIRNYLTAASCDAEAIFGGFAYDEKPPSTEFILRWKYGRAKEQVRANIRNANPYKIVISANYLIRKRIFDDIYGKIIYEGYGYDNFFGALLKRNKIKVLHIDNEVYHLGIEESKLYLRKKEQAAEALVKLNEDGDIPQHDNDLLRLYANLKKFKLAIPLAHAFSGVKGKILQDLLGKNPSISLLQFYRIGYMCEYYRNFRPEKK